MNIYNNFNEEIEQQNKYKEWIIYIKIMKWK